MRYLKILLAALILATGIALFPIQGDAAALESHWRTIQREEILTESLVIKNAHSDMRIDFIIIVADQGEKHVVKRGTTLPGERVEIILPHGEYIFFLRGFIGGEFKGRVWGGFTLPDPGLPDHAKATIFIGGEGEEWRM